MYKVTPHGTIGESPSELHFNRKIRDKISSKSDIEGGEIDEEAKNVEQFAAQDEQAKPNKKETTPNTRYENRPHNSSACFKSGSDPGIHIGPTSPEQPTVTCNEALSPNLQHIGPLKLKRNDGMWQRLIDN